MLATLVLTLPVCILAQVDDMTKTPTYRAFKGWYNVSPPTDTEHNEGADGSQFLCTGEGLRRPGLQEIDRLADWFVSLDKKLRKKQDTQAPSNEVDEAVSYHVGFEDRTAQLTFSNPDDMTMRLLEDIRIHLAKREPLWRVLILGDDDDTTIVVYPTAIILPGDGNPELQLTTIRERAKESHDRTDGVFDRQLAYVKRLLRSQAPLSDPPYLPRIICSFDSSRGDKKCMCIWVLQDGHTHTGRNSTPMEKTADGFIGACGGTCLDVVASGDVLEFLSAENGFVGELIAMSYDKSMFLGYIELLNPDNGKKLKYKIPSESILSDVTVRHRLKARTQTETRKGSCVGKRGRDVSSDN